MAEILDSGERREFDAGGMKMKPDETDILRIVDVLCNEQRAETVITKDIVLRCGNEFPDVHTITVLLMMGNMKKAGLLWYDAKSMMWRVTADGRKRLRGRTYGKE